jgi:hypothetical protein
MSSQEFLSNAKESFKKKLFYQSKQYLKKIFLLENDNIEALNLMALILSEENNLREARNFFNKALKFDPNNYILYFNFAKILSNHNFDFEAVSYYSKAISISPSFKEAYNNCGNSFQKLGNFLQAINYYDKAIKIDPNYSEAIYNKSFSQLISGDFKNGFKNYEVRWLRKKAPKYSHTKINRLNNLSELKDKSLIVFSEQGLGDCIQFSRYIFKLIDYEARKIIFEVDKRLKNFFSYQFSKYDNIYVIQFGENFHITDFQIPLLSLPFLFGSTTKTIPFKDKYFYMGKKIDLTNGKKINIAIACASAQKYTFNHTRNISLKFFLPLIDYSNLFLVQNTVDKEDELFLQQNPEIIFFGKDKNFTDIAILIENVDLVISIDTVFVHLAGALGKKTFLLLGDYSDWRWLLNIKNSIWYSSLTIFRKKMQDNDFKNLFREINKILIIMKKS